ncbi:winged helix-turn-helix transcriptional regulator [Niveispirillum fermenti]|uniref:winged helix-turn-helix transcriptional regulator n=1 Tax=Niveispirillum fermenti TaxID=1233113 RepID=UPI003A8ADCF4
MTGNPVALAHAVFGDAWSQLILREAFFGVRRFNEWSESLRVPRSVLSQRLTHLCEVGIMASVVPPGRKRAEYVLTPMGLDLFGAALIQGQWERKFAPSAMQERYSLTFFNALTGNVVEPVVLDREQGNPIGIDDVIYAIGPGLVERPPPPLRRAAVARVQLERPMIERSVTIVGDYWTWSIVACAFLRFRRFDALLEATGMAPNMLSDRLGRLVDFGLLRKSQYQSSPARHEYRLTDVGLALHPLVLAIHGWSERWLCNFDDPPVRLIRRSTGERITPVVCDRTTGKVISAKKTGWRMEAPVRVR